jgi:hypothetical protein
MNLPVTQLEPGKPRKITFRFSFIYVSPVEIGGNQLMGVLLDRSEAAFRARCYVAIWKKIKYNDKLRKSLMGSLDHVSMKQVIDSAGFGIVTTSSTHLIPRSGEVVNLIWHPWLRNRHLHESGIALGLCGLGCVTSSSEQAV